AAGGGDGGTGRGLRGDFLNHVHRVGDLSGRGGLLTRGVGDVLNQRGEALGYFFDLFQSDSGVLRQVRTAYHFGGGLFHGDHRLVGVGLNGLDQGFDLLGGRRGAFGQALDFI